MDTFCFGKSYWKFNNSLCADKEFVNRFSDKISKLKEEWIPKISDKLLLWDLKKNENEGICYRLLKRKGQV